MGRTVGALTVHPIWVSGNANRPRGRPRKQVVLSVCERVARHRASRSFLQNKFQELRNRLARHRPPQWPVLVCSRKVHVGETVTFLDPFLREKPKHLPRGVVVLIDRVRSWTLIYRTSFQGLDKRHGKYTAVMLDDNLQS